MEGPKPIKIYNGPTQFIFTKEKKAISYNKSSKSFTNLDNFIPSSGLKEYDVFSVLGYIDAIKKSYIICSSHTEFVGKILDAKVFKIKKFLYIPNSGNDIDENDKQYIQMLDDFLSRNPLYYSDKIDLTISFLSMGKKYDISPTSYIFPYTVNQYCWNYSIGKFFDSIGMNEFIYPVINGFFGARAVNEYNKDMQFILIGRKDDRRSGMRFLIRGADSNGNVANCVENEEILIFNDDNYINILSFVQIRGSIPILWSQEPCLLLNPPIRPYDDFGKNSEVFKLHIEELFENYNSICCINLIDKKKDQNIIGEYYSNIVKNYKEMNKQKADLLDFSWFDFHARCKHNKYENIKQLFKSNSVNKSLKNYKYTHIKISKNRLQAIDNENKIEFLYIHHKLLEYQQKQLGTFRTNCIDSLDRSNVVQSSFGRYFILMMLNDCQFSNIPPSDDDIFRKFQGAFENIFKLLWADHGDSLSLAYAGTGALKSDFVRTGKRTFKGNLQDGILSLTRYYINNLRDGYNQDCHDYFLGVLNPRNNKFKVHSFLTLGIYLPVIFFVSIFIFSIFKKMSLPRDYVISLKKVIFQLLLFFGSFALTISLVMTYSKKMFIDLHTRYKKLNDRYL